MKVILLDNIAKIGKKFELRDVSNGHALNFLIPRGLAKIATKKAIKDLEILKKSEEKKEEEKTKHLIENIKKLKNSTVDILAKINKDGGLFAKIDKEDIINAIKDQKALDIEPENIILEKPIKKAGGYTLEIKVDSESAKFKLRISEEE